MRFPLSASSSVFSPALSIPPVLWKDLTEILPQHLVSGWSEVAEPNPAQLSRVVLQSTSEGRDFVQIQATVATLEQRKVGSSKPRHPSDIQQWSSLADSVEAPAESPGWRDPFVKAFSPSHVPTLTLPTVCCQCAWW